jgi:hypothetical protein
MANVTNGLYVYQHVIRVHEQDQNQRQKWSGCLQFGITRSTVLPCGASTRTTSIPVLQGKGS